jgi:Xaa-Pro aminopeptidase
MLPGSNAGDVDRICREAMLQEGLKKTFPQVSGYILGYHSVPRTSDHTRIFMRGVNWIIKAGMVFHMILYTDGMPFSETIHVTESGPVRMTRTPRELRVR